MAAPNLTETLGLDSDASTSEPGVVFDDDVSTLRRREQQQRLLEAPPPGRDYVPIAMGATPHLIEQIVSILSQSATQAANAVSRAIAAQRDSQPTSESSNRDRRTTTARKESAAATAKGGAGHEGSKDRAAAVDPDFDGPIVQKAARDFFEDRANAGLVNLCETICRCLRNLCFSSDNAEKLARCERARAASRAPPPPPPPPSPRAPRSRVEDAVPLARIRPVRAAPARSHRS